jgi:uncharacterized protein with HEPN domain
MNDRTVLEWLRDARNFALEARQMAVEFSQETFETNRRDQLAVRYCLAVVGEALNQVPKGIQALASEVPWAAISGLRNRLVHGFWLIDTGIILRIAQNDTTTLVVSIDRLIEIIEQ